MFSAMDSDVESEISNLDHLADRSSWSSTIDDVYTLDTLSFQMTTSLGHTGEVAGECINGVTARLLSIC